ncbi:hypothetical protein KEM52_005998 [Ascosphaera acerosa]|nr:hypothetical protein KEM52_005998 [Ascosphaera acerosa]
MSQSDSEGGSASGDDDAGTGLLSADALKPPYPYEKYFFSAQEKEEIMALPEIQREETLSERAQVYERHLQDIALRRLLAGREREEAALKRRKRKASPSSDERDREHGGADSPRKSTRQKMTVGGRKVGEISSAMEAYKKQREEKEERTRARKREADSRRSTRAAARDDSGDERRYDYDSESDRERHYGRDRSRERSRERDRARPRDRAASDVEWEDARPRRRSVTPPRDDPPASLHDINRARIGRSGFAQLCFYPRFDELIAHCFVRTALGPNRQTGTREYRLAQIKAIREGKPYAMEGINGRTFITDQYALVAHGKAEKEFPFIFCSDSPFTEAEYNRWRQTLVVEDCRMPTKSQVDSKVRDINSLLNHSFTKEELDEKLRRQGAASSKQIAFERMAVEKERAAAVAANDEAAIAQCDEKLRRLNGSQRLAFGTSLNKAGGAAGAGAANSAARKNSTSESAQRLAELNRRNARLNAENVRRAQIEERRQAKMLAAKKAAAKQEQAAQAAQAKAAGQLAALASGPSSAPRSSGETSNATGAGSRSGSGSHGDQSNGNHNASSSSGSQATGALARKNGAAGIIRHRPTDDEAIAAMDLDLDIEL